MKSESQLTIPEAETALTTVQTPNVAQMMSAIIDRGVTQENVTALEKVIELYERMETRNAEKLFNAAFVSLQQDLPVIVAKTAIANRGKYEKYEDVLNVVGPLLTKHGFSVNYSQSTDATRITMTCHLRHIAGHSTSTAFAVRVGKADTDTQADCKASTTAKRNALLACLNIVIRQDALQDEEGDGRIEGTLIEDDKIQHLKEQVKETGFNETTFFALAGCKSYEEITSGKYPVLINALSMKARQAR